MVVDIESADKSSALFFYIILWKLLHLDTSFTSVYSSTMNIVGIDVGSVALSLVMMDEKKAIITSSYQFHHGAIIETLRSMLSGIDVSRLVF